MNEIISWLDEHNTGITAFGAVVTATASVVLAWVTIQLRSIGVHKAEIAKDQKEIAARQLQAEQTERERRARQLRSEADQAARAAIAAYRPAYRLLNAAGTISILEHDGYIEISQATAQGDGHLETRSSPIDRTGWRAAASDRSRPAGGGRSPQQA